MKIDWTMFIVVVMIVLIIVCFVGMLTSMFQAHWTPFWTYIIIGTLDVATLCSAETLNSKLT